MTDRYIKKCSTSSGIRETYIKPSITYHHKHPKMAKNKNDGDTKC